MNRCIDLSKFNLSLKVASCLLPLRLKSLAVATPWRIQLNHPNIFGLHDKRIEIGFSQFNNFICVSFFVPGAGAAGRFGISAIASSHSFFDQGIDFIETIVNNFVASPSTIVILRARLLLSKVLDGWDTLDPVLATESLILFNIYCTHSNDSP